MKVFLGGTCNGSKWRDEIIPLLKIDYFNPVIDDWTEDSMITELEERRTSDYCLYVLTPKMTGVYSVAEVVDDSNKRPDKTLMVVLRNDESESFSDFQWQSLGAVKALVEENGGRVFDDLKSAAICMNGE